MSDDLDGEPRPRGAAPDVGANETGPVVPPAATSFVTVTPCRRVDTRSASLGGPAPLAAGSLNRFTLTGAPCAVPATAAAVSLNLTVTGPATAGHLRPLPAGGAEPRAPALNYPAGVTRANNAIIGRGRIGRDRDPGPPAFGHGPRDRRRKRLLRVECSKGTAMDLSALYSRHVERLQAETEKALDESGFDSLVVSSGAPFTYFADDRDAPFEPAPHFAHWCPLDCPHHLLHVVPGPGDRRNCVKCHVPGANEPPLPAGVLPTLIPQADGSVKAIQPIASACVGCHTKAAAQAHMDTMTSQNSGEACVTCHGIGRPFAVEKVHRR